MIPYLRPDNPPLALAILKGSLEMSGIETKVRDFNIDVIEYFTEEEIKEIEKFCSDTSYYNKKLIMKIRKFYRYVIKKHIKEFSPDVVGLSLFSFFMQRTAELFSLEIKNFNPKCKVFMGGSGVTRFFSRKTDNSPDKIDDWSKNVINKNIADAVIIGEGENAVVDFCKNKIKDIVIVPQLKDLESMSKTNFDGIDIKKYSQRLDNSFNKPGPVVTITGSRGCPRKCSYCNVEAIWPSFVFRPAKQIVDEMEEYIKKLGVRKFKFTDSLVNGSSSNWRKLNSEIIERDLDIEYTGQFIAKPHGQTLDNDYVLAKKAGASHLSIGIESGSESVRNHMQKKFDNFSLYETIDNLNKNNIKQQWMLITGYPTETEEDFEDTINLLKKYKEFGHMISISIVSFLLLSDSPIASQDKYKDLKFINGNTNNESIENFWICLNNPTLNFEQRLTRYHRAIDTAIECGYLNTNLDSYKKRITFYDTKTNTQILS